MYVDVASKGPLQLRVSTRPWSSTATEPKPEAKGKFVTAPQPRVGFIMCFECKLCTTVVGECPFRWHTAVKNSLKQQVVPANWLKPQVSYGKR